MRQACILSWPIERHLQRTGDRKAALLDDANTFAGYAGDGRLESTILKL
jgi:hypothetical protein